MNWRLAAACAHTDPELFFTNDATAKLRAKRICATCPVRPECLALAMGNERAEDPRESPVTNLKRRYGIYAGVTPRGRWEFDYPEDAHRLREESARKRRQRRKEAK